MGVVVAMLSSAFSGGDTATKPSIAASASPSPSSDEEGGQPQPQILPMPKYPSVSTCGKGTNDEPGDLDKYNVLGFEGLCVPQTNPPADYASWKTGGDGDWVKGRQGVADLCQPSGCTSVLLWLSPKPLASLKEAARLWTMHDTCPGKPAHSNWTMVGSLLTLHLFTKGCGDNEDQINHDWFVMRPDGRVFVIVAESPESMNPGKPDGSKTPARVGESMSKATYFRE
jgi:hypothetical protein